MAKTYTDKELALINQQRKAVASKKYLQDNGDLYVGGKQGTLEFVTSNFVAKTTNVIADTLASSETTEVTVSQSESDPSKTKIDITINQMKLGDVLAFAAAN